MTSKSFCVLPFFNREIFLNDYETPCCLLPKCHDIQQIRTDMMNDVRSEWCKACWDIEDAGLKSDRLIKNESYDFYADKDIIRVEQEVKSGNYSIQMLKISTTNLCNATCATCNSGSSSAWGALLGDSTYVKIPIEVYDNIDWKQIVYINIMGGEPLYEKTTWYILDKLLSAGNKDCFISITTNGSIYPKGDRLAILKQIKNLSINFSIDGTGKVFEYMRFPLTWDKTLENISKFRTFVSNNSVSYTVSNLNVIYLNQTMAWLKQEGLPNGFNIVSYPSYFSPSAFPDEIKAQYPDNVFMQKQKPDDLLQFYSMLSEIKKQDKLKGIRVQDYMPEFFNLIESYYVEV